MLALILPSCFLINMGISSFHRVPSWTFLDSVWFVFQLLWCQVNPVSHYSFSAFSWEEWFVSPFNVCFFSHLLILICRVWKWLASVSWRLRKRKLPRAWSCWTSSSKLWQSRWVRDLMCSKWLLFWIPPRPLLNVMLGFYIVTAPSLCPTSFLTKGNPGRNACGYEDRRALVSERAIHSSCELISKCLLKGLCSVPQTCGIFFLISRNTAWNTVRVSWVLSQVIALSSPLIFSFQKLGLTQKLWEQVWSFVLRLCFP